MYWKPWYGSSTGTLVFPEGSPRCATMHTPLIFPAEISQGWQKLPLPCKRWLPTLLQKREWLKDNITVSVLQSVWLALHWFIDSIWRLFPDFFSPFHVHNQLRWMVSHCTHGAFLQPKESAGHLLHPAKNPSSLAPEMKKYKASLPCLFP